MKHAVQVTILGQQYTVRSESPAEEVRRVADFVNRQIAEVKDGGRVVDTQNIIVLALLNVAGSYLRACDESPKAEMEKRIGGLLKRLEDAFPDPPA